MTPSSVSRPFTRAGAGRAFVPRSLALAALLAAAGLLAGSIGHGAAPTNLVAIEFREAPISDLQVTGGYLGVPDSAGNFPPRYQRYDPGTGVNAPIGEGFGNLLVFQGMKPGSYRVALFHLEQSRAFKALMGKNAEKVGNDVCLVYGDSVAALTFAVGPTDLKFLGRITRRNRPSTAAADTTAAGGGSLWKTTIEWSPGDERKAWKDLLKRKDLADWHPRLEERLGAIEAAEKAEKKR